MSAGGLASEQDYPYKGTVKTHRCLAKQHRKVAWIQDFLMLQFCEQSADRVETRTGTAGRVTGTDRTGQMGLEMEME